MIRRLEFRVPGSNEVELALHIGPAVVGMNALFDAACMAFVKPYSLAQQAGRLTEEEALVPLAKAYAEAVIVRSESPEHEGFRPADWEKWLLANPEKFAIIRSIAEVKRNFDPDAEVNHAQQPAGPTTTGGGHPT